ncbi:MAG: NAD(P)-binding domain-containing protein [Bdellovibrionaceae bacterium]|nr:NAD(P)-binding domain-containing protein [Pseudobdellovibrionaceae bacterium]
MTTKIGIIGSGNVGSAIQRGLTKAGFESRVSTEDNVSQIADGADVIVLAVPYLAIDDVVKKLGSTINGKIVIDATNALTQTMQLALGHTTSGAEELQKKIPKAKVVKAFNTVFAQHMDSGTLNGQTLTAFAASDDEAARNKVLQILRSMGFDAVHAGPLQNARYLEALGYLNIQLGYVLGNGAMTGFKYVR